MASCIFRTICQQTVEIERPTGFRTGPRESFAAERLYADDRPHHIPVNVQVAYVRRTGDLGNGFINTGVDAQRQTVARRR